MNVVSAWSLPSMNGKKQVGHVGQETRIMSQSQTSSVFTTKPPTSGRRRSPAGSYVAIRMSKKMPLGVAVVLQFFSILFSLHPHSFSPLLASSHLFSSLFTSSQLFLPLLSSPQPPSPLLNSFQLYSTFLAPSLLTPTPLTSSQLFSSLFTSSQLFSSLLTSSHLFSPLLNSSRPFSAHLNSAHLFSTPPHSCHLFSTLLTWFHLLSTLLAPSQLISTILTSSHLCATLLSSSELIRSHFTLYSMWNWTDFISGVARSFSCKLLRSQPQHLRTWLQPLDCNLQRSTINLTSTQKIHAMATEIAAPRLQNTTESQDIPQEQVTLV